MKIISYDKEKKFQEALVKGEAVDLLFDIIDSESEFERPTKQLTGNGLNIIGHLIPLYNKRKLSKYMGMRIIELTKGSDLGIRRNSFFCLRMMIQKDTRTFLDKNRLLEHLLFGLLDYDEKVVEESMKAILYLLENNEIADVVPLLEKIPLFEILCGSDHQSIARNAEKVLLRICPN